MPSQPEGAGCSGGHRQPRGYPGGQEGSEQLARKALSSMKGDSGREGTEIGMPWTLLNGAELEEGLGERRPDRRGRRLKWSAAEWTEGAAAGEVRCWIDVGAVATRVGRR